MKKYVLGATAAMFAAGAAQAADYGAAVSNTVGAAGDKIGQGVESVKETYHESRGNAAMENLKSSMKKGDVSGTLDNAGSALEHKTEAAKARAKESEHKAKAQQKMDAARRAISETTPTRR